MHLDPKTYEAIVAAMADAVFLCSPDRTLLYLNPAAGRLSGWSPAAAVGRKCNGICRTIRNRKHAGRGAKQGQRIQP